MPGKTILVIVDPHAGDRQPAVERAAWLADALGAALELYACDYDSEVETGAGASAGAWAADAARIIVDGHRRHLEALAAPLRARGLTVNVDAEWDYPLEAAIVRKAAALSPWLVAKTTQYYNAVQRALLTNTDWHLIRHVAAPLLLVKPQEIPARPQVVAAVDPLHEHDKPADLDDAIMTLAAELAQGCGAGLRVVHGFALPMNLPLPPDSRELVRREHRNAMDAFMRARGVPAEDVHLLEGRADQVLERAARDFDADFIVMGAVARRGLKRLFIGSTAERVLDKLPCDLVIVKPKDFAARAAHGAGEGGA